jgi:hypothetical protein
LVIDHKPLLIAFRKVFQSTYDIELDNMLLAIALSNPKAQEVWIDSKETEERPLGTIVSCLEQWMNL